MNKLSTDKRVAILSAITEGVGIRATCRLTGAAKGTVTRLVVEAGEACQRFHDETVKGLNVKRVEIDEVWAYCGMKERNVPADKKGILGYGDVWLWSAIDSESKFVPSWLIGHRNAEYAAAFVADLRSRIQGHTQITSDGLKLYLEPIENEFGGDADYAMLIKMFGTPEGAGPEQKYSPNECTGIKKTIVTGNPKREHISTSIIERSHKTLRMTSRRYTRLTDGHSKKLRNHCAAVALAYTTYNFSKIHSSIRCTPAQEAGLITKLWSMKDIVALLDRYPAGSEIGEDSN